MLMQRSAQATVVKVSIIPMCGDDCLFRDEQYVIIMGQMLAKLLIPILVYTSATTTVYRVLQTLSRTPLCACCVMEGLSSSL